MGASFGGDDRLGDGRDEFSCVMRVSSSTAEFVGQGGDVALLE
jgi:hypothetical protein